MDTIFLYDAGDGSRKPIVERLIQESNPRLHSVVRECGDADVILIVGVREANLYRDLRLCSLRRTFTSQCYLYSEIDNPPMLLHGIAPSIPRWKALGRRFAGFHFPLHSVLHPNEPPIIYSHQMKPYLMSFVGQRSSSVRSRILRHKWSDRVYVADTTNAYSHFSSENHEHPVKSRMRADYWTTLQASAFSLCPRGHGASALRIYEAMRAGVVPIILSDSWVPPVGIDWSQCSIRIKESDYYRAELIAARHLSRASQMGQAAQEVWKQNFSPEKFSYRLKLSIDYLRTHQISDESVCQVFTPAFTFLELAHRIRIQSTVALKQLVVRALALR